MSTRQLHQHTDWCAHNHQCQLGEHRAEPITLTLPRMGTFTVTRVQAVNGREHAEIRISIPLAAGTTAARAHLAHILRLLHAFIRHAPLSR